MPRRSERIKQSGKGTMRTKQKANRKTPVQIESSPSNSVQEEVMEAAPLETVFPEGVQEETIDKGMNKNSETEGTSSVKEKESGDQQEKLPEEEVPEKSPKARKRKSVPLSRLISKKTKVSATDEAGSSKGKEGTDKELKGNSLTIPDNWFLNSQAKEDWEGGYKDRSIAYCSILEPELQQILTSKAFKNLKKSQFRKIFNVGLVAYPRLTKLFYLNMTNESVKGKLIIRTSVAGISMVISHDTIREVLGIKTFNKTLPTRKECLEEGKKLFLQPGQNLEKQLTHSSLTIEAKLLFTVLIRCIVPKAASKELVTDKMIELMYLLESSSKIDAASTIMDHMVSCKPKGRNHSLPYGNILPLFFDHFSVPVEGEEIEKNFGTVDEEALQKLGMCYTKGSEWKFYSDLTAKDKREKKFIVPRSVASTSNPPTSVNNSKLLEKLDLLEDKVDDLKGEVQSLSQTFEGFKLLLDNVYILLQASKSAGGSEEEVAAGGKNEEAADLGNDSNEEKKEVSDEGDNAASGSSDEDDEDGGDSDNF